MKRWLAILVVLGGWSGLASAQTGYTPPQTSPYPGGLPPALSLTPNPYYQYYGLALPQYNQSRALQQLQTQVNQSGYLPLGVGVPGMSLQPQMITGHSVSFQNMSHYYPTGGQPFAGMGAFSGVGMGGVGAGMGPNVNMPLPQGYAQYRY